MPVLLRLFIPMVMLFRGINNPRRLKNMGIQAKLLSHMGQHMLPSNMIISLRSGLVADTRVTEVVTSLIMLWDLPSALALIGLVDNPPMPAPAAMVLRILLLITRLHLTHSRLRTISSPLYP